MSNLDKRFSFQTRKKNGFRTKQTKNAIKLFLSYTLLVCKTTEKQSLGLRIKTFSFESCLTNDKITNPKMDYFTH